MGAGCQRYSCTGGKGNDSVTRWVLTATRSPWAAPCVLVGAGTGTQSCGRLSGCGERCASCPLLFLLRVLLQQPCRARERLEECPQSRRLIRLHLGKKKKARLGASSSDLCSRLCNSSGLELCHGGRAGLFPLPFPVRCVVLFNCPSPSSDFIHPWFRWELLHTPLSAVLSVSPQDWEVLVLEKLKWDLVSVIANDFLAHILHHLPLPKDKMELVKKHAQTFIALCATGGCLLLLGSSTGGVGSGPRGCPGVLDAHLHWDRSTLLLGDVFSVPEEAG